jgi:hypothetical protein
VLDLIVRHQRKVHVLVVGEKYTVVVFVKSRNLAHKSICAILKRLPNKLQSYDEAVRFIDKILASNKGNEIRFLEQLLSYADNQFGSKVEGRDYRVRIDCERISNWDVCINNLLNIGSKMTDFYAEFFSQSLTILYSKMFPHLERSLTILRSWMVTMDSDGSNQSNSLNSRQIVHLLRIPFHSEQSVALVAMNRNQFDVVEGPCHRCLANARRHGIEGEEKLL